MKGIKYQKANQRENVENSNNKKTSRWTVLHYRKLKIHESAKTEVILKSRDTIVV